MEQNNVNLKSKASVKVFETISTWFLGLSLLVGILLFLRGLNLLTKLYKNININYSFVDLVLELVKHETDLKHIYTLALIYRVFVLINILVLSVFIIFRLVRLEYKKIMKFNVIIYISSIIFSSYLIFITKDIFYAIKSINNRIYSTDFSKTMYLLQRLQNIKDIKYILFFVFIITLVLTFIALIINFYESAIKKDELLYKKINVSFLVIILLSLITISYNHYNIFVNRNKINANEYMILTYDIDENNNIIPTPNVDYKKIDKKYIDPYIRNFLKMGLAFDIDKKDISTDKNKNMKVKVSYDVNVAQELDLNIKKLEFFVKNKEVPYILKDINKLNKKSLMEFIKKYDDRFLDKSKSKEDENTGLFYSIDKNSNVEIYLIQNVELNLAPIEVKKSTNEDKKYVYQLMYLGNVFVSEKGEVLSYIGMNNDYVMNYDDDANRVKTFIKEAGLEKVK